MVRMMRSIHIRDVFAKKISRLGFLISILVALLLLLAIFSKIGRAHV